MSEIIRHNIRQHCISKPVICLRLLSLNYCLHMAAQSRRKELISTFHPDISLQAHDEHNIYTGSFRHYESNSTLWVPSPRGLLSPLRTHASILSVQRGAEQHLCLMFQELAKFKHSLKQKWAWMFDLFHSSKKSKAQLKGESDVSEAQFVHTHSPDKRLNQLT